MHSRVKSVLLGVLLLLPVSAYAAPSVSLVPSRTTGVAPLGVTFDATGTTDPAVTSKPFHDLEYTWNFGDDDAATWSNGAHVNDGSIFTKKNRASGPLAGHTYENPGTYTVTLSVYDGITTATQTQIITVTDPNTVYSGTNTICFGNALPTAGSGGCPTGATAVATTTFDSAVASCIGPGKRCLFNRGDSFTSSQSAIVSTAGPVTIGAYGTGSLPVIHSSVAGVINLRDADDTRMMDLDIDGTIGDQGICMDTWSTPSNILVLRLTCRDIGKGGIVIESGSNMSQSIIQDNHFYNISSTGGGGGVAYFGWSINSAFLGNSFGPNAAGTEQVFRLQQGQKVTISNNTMTTPGTSGKEVVSIRAVEHTPSSYDLNSYSNPDTQYIYVSDNKLMGGASSAQILWMAPGGTPNQWISDVIIDRNWFVYGPHGQDAVTASVVRLTIRNNACDATGSSFYRGCFNITSASYATAPIPIDNTVFNNTCYSGDTSRSFYCVWMMNGRSEPITNTSVANNIAYGPLATDAKAVAMGDGVTGTVGASGTYGNSSDDQVKNTNPNFVSASPSSLSDFQLSSASYAIGSGVQVPGVFRDFFNVLRGTTIDSGAFQFSPYIAPTPTPPPPPVAPTPPPAPSPTPSPSPTPTASPTPTPVVSVSSTPHTGLTEAQIQAILSLLTSFNADATAIAKVNAALRGTTIPSTTTSASTFTRNLQLYSSGTDVQNLQKYLNTHGYPIATSGNGSLGKESSIFGPATFKALVKFQSAHHLKPTGYLGPLTRALMK